MIQSELIEMKVLKIVSIFFGVLTAFISLAELAAQLQLRYHLSPNYESRFTLLRPQIFSESWHLRYIPSPYFGYVCDHKRKGQPMNEFCNNHGFSDSKDFPYIKEGENEVVIGIFGGSVAENLGKYALENRESLVQSILRPLNGKNIVILNFALGGYKAWQSYNVLSYYLNTIDIAIVFDGQNELDTRYIKGTFFDFPLLDFRDGKSMAQTALHQLRQLTLDFYSLGTKYPWLHESALFYTLLKTSFNISARFSLFQYGNEHLLDLSDLNQNLQRWKETIEYSRAVVFSQNKKYFHFVQPSPYFSDKKPMSELEKRVTLKSDPNHSAHSNYSLISARRKFYEEAIAIRFKESQSLEAVFDEEPEIVYEDDCCHLNERGNHIILEAIMDKIRRSAKETIKAQR